MTHSSQTLKSHYREDIFTQTYEQKEAESMTMRDDYTNVPNPANFIAGLRGEKTDTAAVVNLTRPREESYCRIPPTFLIVDEGDEDETCPPKLM